MGIFDTILNRIACCEYTHFVKFHSKLCNLNDSINFQACSLGSFASFGLLFNDFLNDLNAGTSAVTIITGSYFSACSFAGLFASSLFKKFPIRNIGLFGATIYFLGSLMVPFATSVEHLIVSFGIMGGDLFRFLLNFFY